MHAGPSQISIACKQASDKKLGGAWERGSKTIVAVAEVFTVGTEHLNDNQVETPDNRHGDLPTVQLQDVITKTNNHKDKKTVTNKWYQF